MGAGAGRVSPCYRRGPMKRLLGLTLVLTAHGGAQTESTVTAASTSASALTPTIATRAAKKIRTVAGITEYRLDNGLQVLLFPDATQSTVTVNVTYLVGS